ncbi:MAG: 5-oxoprolinase/urea amidolyase family protein [Planctomycetota bacterium]|nr:MAG: 5-oxoprolinase/urea amidolyase family protein [Planctomycetota bacterium]
MVATLSLSAPSRPELLSAARARLRDIQLGGISHDGHRLLALLESPAAIAGRWHPAQAVLPPPAGAWCEILEPGLETTVQDWPGRLGAWEVGVPPSGPMDDRSFRLANACVGNAEGAPALEVLLAGPSLRFSQDSVAAVCGAPVSLSVDGVPAAMYDPLHICAGSVLRIGPVAGRGLRCYVAIRGGIRVPSYLGSASTFTLGGFGGHAGRPLVRGDRLALGDGSGDGQSLAAPKAIPRSAQPRFPKEWTIRVTLGPHAAPDFLTPEGLHHFLQAPWTVSARSNRTGVRLDGPKPQWARADGDEAGLHPSNLHDNGYAIGAVDFTGDTPVILGPDGPSCGGFACPVVIPTAERWKMGQLRPGDRLHWQPIDQEQAALLRARPDAPTQPTLHQGPVRERRPATADHPGLCLRQAGDGYLLIEYGAHELDIAYRLRVQRLHQRLLAEAHPGIIDLVPGVRSLLVHVDPLRWSIADLQALLLSRDAELSAADGPVPSRRVRLPLSWDDMSTREAAELYQRTVNPSAPWCPWNLEFIRRINGLESVAAVRDICFSAEYLVLGLGDVYLGAPVATPLDPRHRLVTTKYNPARTWTPENAVGIGGAYLCIYGMEGPGGYQFIGRTIPVWNTWKSTPCFAPDAPWLLRQFDRMSWYPVSHEELLDLRADMRAGTFVPEIIEEPFDPAAHSAFCAQHAGEIAAAKARQQAAFNEERARWETAR